MGVFAGEQLRLPIREPNPGPVPATVTVLGLERLGGSDEFGRVIVRLLELDGWAIAELHGFAGGVGLDARKPPAELRVHGDTLAEAAVRLLVEVARLRGAGR